MFVEGTKIHAYHTFTNNIIFHGNSTDPFIGIELETDSYPSAEARKHCAEQLYTLESKNESIFHMEMDSSLNTGIEIITMPCTIKWAWSYFWFSRIAKIVDQNGGKSHDSDSCGLHFHVNRSFFGNNYNAHMTAALKLCWFYERWWDNMVKMSRRSPAGYNLIHYANRYNMNFDYVDETNIARITRMYESAKENGRYHAINLCKNGTIEFRIARGTLILKTMRANLEWVDFISRFVKEHSLAEIKAASWDDIIDQIKIYGQRVATNDHHRDLLNYMVARRVATQEQIDRPCQRMV